MIATRTRSSLRGRCPFLDAMDPSLVRPSRSESVSTMSSLMLRPRSEALRASRSFSSGGMRRTTSRPARGRDPPRPLGSNGSATLAARWPTAMSLRLRPVRATSSASRSLRAAGSLVKTTERASTEVLAAYQRLCEVAELPPDVEDPLEHREPGRRGEERDRPRQDTPRRQDEAACDDDDALGARSDAHVAAQPERLRPRARVADE